MGTDDRVAKSSLLSAASVSQVLQMQKQFEWRACVRVRVRHRQDPNLIEWYGLRRAVRLFPMQYAIFKRSGFNICSSLGLDIAV